MLYFFSILGYLIFYQSYFQLLFLIFFIIISSLLYCTFYDKYIDNNLKIDNKFYANISGDVIYLKEISNNSKKSLILTLNNIIITKPKENTIKQGKKNSKLYSKNFIKKNYTNLDDYMDIDIFALSYKDKYVNPNWVKNNNIEYILNPPKKIKIIIPSHHNKKPIRISDKISINAFFYNSTNKIFPGDFDYKIYNKSQKISGLGIASSIPLTKSNNNINFFSKIRIIISSKIDKSLINNQNAIAKALLIGDKSNISKNINDNINNAGISHLLSISGFHIALAGGIFFIITRYILSRSEYISLNFNIKLIASIIALIACFFYFAISGCKIPTQRAFLAFLIAIGALLKKEKLNIIRALSIIAIIIAIFNPYNVANIGYQLSFMAVIIIAKFAKKYPYKSRTIILLIINYIYNILIISIFIQIFSLPILLYNFGKINLLSPIANIIAIPITSFITMPLGFLSILLMPLNLQDISLNLMGKSINIIELLSYLISHAKYNNIKLDTISGYGSYISFIISIILITNISQNQIKIYILYILTLLFLIKSTKYDIAFNKDQNFFVIFDHEKQLLKFSKKIRSQKIIKKWQDNYINYNHIFANNCDQYCLINIKNKQLIIINSRLKNTTICNFMNYDYVINLTRKYKLPNCIVDNKKIDNIDFAVNGGHFFKISNKIKINFSK